MNMHQVVPLVMEKLEISWKQQIYGRFRKWANDHSSQQQERQVRMNQLPTQINEDDAY